MQNHVAKYRFVIIFSESFNPNFVNKFVLLSKLAWQGSHAPLQGPVMSSINQNT